MMTKYLINYMLVPDNQKNVYELKVAILEMPGVTKGQNMARVIKAEDLIFAGTKNI